MLWSTSIRLQCFQRFLSVLLEDVFGKSHLVIPQVPEHKQEQNHVAESTLLGAAKWLKNILEEDWEGSVVEIGI